MTLTITINLDGCAFDVRPDCEVARLLETCIGKIREQLRRPPCLCDHPEAADTLYDINGNRCGSLVLAKETNP